jgi:hypothetical protein
MFVHKYRKRDKVLWIIFFIVYGVFAIFSFHQIYELIILKKSHELVEGVIEKIEHESAGKSFTYWLICSYMYEGKLYNKKIYVSGGVPFLTSLSKEYPRGKTIFMVNIKKDIAFPKDRINLELRRQLFLLILFTFGVILLKYFSKQNKF